MIKKAGINRLFLYNLNFLSYFSKIWILYLPFLIFTPTNNQKNKDMETENTQTENTNQTGAPTSFQHEIPNASVILILGIIALIIAFFNSLVGIVAGVAALVIARNAEHLYHQTPRLYTLSSYSNIRSGRTCAIIGIVIAILKIILIGTILGLLGAFIPWDQITHGNIQL
ncbi:hypothetical protein SD074_00530 [Prolixibacter sp. SD074]|nr:hypothetical protein SD074_00530 [Prolixibacter sp. SD074]